jgi:flagellar protein FlgJ
MLRPDFASAAVSASFAQEAQRIALPLNGAGGGFSALMNEVRSEVNEFIANGSGSLGSIHLSAEGSVQRAQVQGAAPAVDRTQQQSFIASVAPWARETADRLGVAPELIAAHAALESGWGQRPLRGADGGSTHNLFGLKAGASWSGDVASALTTEFEDGVVSKQRQDFRSYADEASAFRDYAQLLLDHPRFRSVVNAGNDAQAFAQGLVQGRYATDPAYAHKLQSVTRQVRDIGFPKGDY